MKNKKKNIKFDVLFFVGATGFEPATPWSQTRCATNCATPRDGYIIRFQRNCPPAEIFFCRVVGATGFEPATPWSQTRCATNCATPRKHLFKTADTRMTRTTTQEPYRFRVAKLLLFLLPRN